MNADIALKAARYDAIVNAGKVNTMSSEGDGEYIFNLDLGKYYDVDAAADALIRGEQL